MTNAPPKANPRLGAALAYAERGWHVLPCHYAFRSTADEPRCSCGRNDCGNIGKHPLTPNGLTNATTDPQVIGGWWRRWPLANVAIATGERSGCFAVDVDPRHGGNKSFADLMDEYGEPPETVEAKTGGGGSHLLFIHPGFKVMNDSMGKRLGPGLDVRGDGGYILVAPSNHASGNCYEWVAMLAPDECQLSVAPDWILSRVKEQPKPQPSDRKFEPTKDETARHWLGKYLAKASHGNRNEVGAKLCQQLRDSGLSQSEAERTMLEYAERVPRGDQPYADREALATTRSIFSRTAREPAKNLSASPQTPPPRPKAPIAKPAEPPTGAAAELEKYLMDFATGRLEVVPWPWTGLSELTCALAPGTVTVVCGEAGVGKTYLILQCLMFWQQRGYEPAVFFIEKNRVVHTHRLLVQLEKDSKLIDLMKLGGRQEEITAAMDRWREVIGDIGRLIFSAPHERVTLDSLLGWIRQQASAGKRIIIIDPITAVSAGESRWTKDDDFMIEAQSIMTAHEASLVLVTHPKQGAGRKAPSTGHDVAGGAAYLRFTDTLLWLHKSKEPKFVKLMTPLGIINSELSLFFQMHKTRNGRGKGREFGFLFCDGMRYAEQGLVIGPADEREVEKEKNDPFA